MYNVYLAHTKLRSNPVFANLDRLVDQMMTVKIADIGIVSSEVRLDGSAEYLQGESEFRVMPSQVLSTKRLI